MHLQCDYNYYDDVNVAFGYKHGSAQMQRLGDTIGNVGIQSAVDAHRAFDTLKALVDNLGLPINPQKLESGHLHGHFG